MSLTPHKIQRGRAASYRFRSADISPERLRVMCSDISGSRPPVQHEGHIRWEGEEKPEEAQVLLYYGPFINLQGYKHAQYIWVITNICVAWKSTKPVLGTILTIGSPNLTNRVELQSYYQYNETPLMYELGFAIRRHATF